MSVSRQVKYRRLTIYCLTVFCISRALIALSCRNMISELQAGPVALLVSPANMLGSFFFANSQLLGLYVAQDLTSIMVQFVLLCSRSEIDTVLFHDTANLSGCKAARCLPYSDHNSPLFC